MRRRRSWLGVALVLASLILFVGVSSASVCPKDAPGTRTLAVTGHVEGYTLDGATIKVVVRKTHGCEEASLWRPLHGPMIQSPTSVRVTCQAASESTLGRAVLVQERPTLPLQVRDGVRRAVLGPDGVIGVFRGPRQFRRISRGHTTLALKIELSGDRIVVLTKGSSAPDRPYALEVYDVRTGSMLHTWPLLGKPATLDLYLGTALFSARNSGGLFAIRLSDGKTTNLGPVRPSDRPQINRFGVVFQSNFPKPYLRQGRVLMKFLPTATLQGQFARTVDTLVRSWPAKAFAMDGARVAVVLDAPGTACDAVGVWNIPRHWFVRVNMVEHATCGRHLALGSDLAIAGIGAGWVGTKAGRSQAFYSDTTTCVESVAGSTRSARAPIAGDGRLLAFGGIRRAGSPRGAVALANWKTEKEVFADLPSAARALSVDQGRVAVLRADNRVSVLAVDGSLITTLKPQSPRAIALRGSQLAVATGSGRLELWDLESRSREHSWLLPRGTRPAIDVQYGIAVFSSARTVYAMRLDTGRVVALAHVPHSTRVQIEEPGVVYAYNTGRGSVMRFIALAAVEGPLRLH